VENQRMVDGVRAVAMVMTLIAAGMLMSTAGAQEATRTRKADGSSVSRDVPYVDFAYRRHDRHRLDLVVPPRTEGERVPVVVWIHGGAFWAGSKEDESPAQGLVDRGFAVCSINYRLSNSAPFPAQVQDCKSAIRWLRKHADDYGIDPDRRVGGVGRRVSGGDGRGDGRSEGI
jgi:acetyl esterase/lipase